VKKIAVLGLDIGTKRIGVAGCDGLGLIATGLTTIYRVGFDRDLAAFAEIVADRQVDTLVVGLPYTMDGSLGKQAQQVQKYATRLARLLQLNLEYTDERLTSVAAEEAIAATGQIPSRNKADIDKKAAAIILQQWLDERRSKTPKPILADDDRVNGFQGSIDLEDNDRVSSN
jgi:putative holliday junction resolvase